MSEIVPLTLEMLRKAVEAAEEDQREHTEWCGCITGVDMFGQEVTLCCERHLADV